MPVVPAQDIVMPAIIPPVGFHESLLNPANEAKAKAEGRFIERNGTLFFAVSAPALRRVLVLPVSALRPDPSSLCSLWLSWAFSKEVIAAGALGPTGFMTWGST
jgi:hypothetical protein